VERAGFIELLLEFQPAPFDNGWGASLGSREHCLYGEAAVPSAQIKGLQLAGYADAAFHPSEWIWKQDAGTNQLA
jgi:hypothetical protein